MSFSIGGTSLAPQQLAAPQERPAASTPVDVPKNDPPPSANPPGIGKVVDKTA